MPIQSVHVCVNRMGLYELLLLCEALGAGPQMSVFTGYCKHGPLRVGLNCNSVSADFHHCLPADMGAPYTPISEASQWSQAALDMIEFAIGDASTPYGRKRVAAGHAAPFKLERVEVVRSSMHRYS